MELNMKQWQIIILIGLLIFTFILTYSPHLDYHYPYHIDEYHHITQSLHLKNGEYNFNSPSSLEIGYHSFLAFLSLFFSLVSIYQFLPAIFTTISAVILFFLVKKKFNFFVAILSVLFFALIPSNVNTLGHWFAIPLTFALPFLLLFVYFFTESIDNNQPIYLVYSFLFLLITTVIHPVSASFMLPILLIYLVLNKNFVIKNKKIIITSFLIPLLALPVFFGFLTSKHKEKGIIETIEWSTNYVIFEKGWGGYEPELNIPALKFPVGNNMVIVNSFILIALYGLVPTVLFLLGLFYSFKQRKYWFFITWPAITVFLILLFLIFEATILAPFQRLIFYTMIGMVFLSALGLYKILKFLKQKNILLVFLVLGIIIAFPLFNYYDLPDNLNLYKPINEDEYKALSLLKNRERGRVLADRMTSVAIYPITQNKPVSTLYFYKKNNNAFEKFKKGNCKKKNNIKNKNNIKYILINQKQNCNWTLIYNKKPYIYQVK